MAAHETKSNAASLSSLITRREAAALLRIDESMLRVHEKAGRIPPAVVRASESDRRRRAFHLRADVVALQERLAHEALARRTQEQADCDFEEALADGAKHTRLIELEDLAYEFERRKRQEAQEARQKELEGELAARAVEEKFSQRMRVLERQERQREDERRGERLEAESRNALLLAGGLAAATLAAGGWVARSSASSPIETISEGKRRELADKLRALMPDAAKLGEPELFWNSVSEAFEFLKSLLQPGGAIDTARAR